VAGLLLGAALLAAAPVEDLVYRRLVRQQGREFAEMFFDAVRNGEPYKAHCLMIDPLHRRAVENQLPQFYAKTETQRKQLKQFVNEPVMRTLFALGKDAQYRFYETAADPRITKLIEQRMDARQERKNASGQLDAALNAHDETAESAAKQSLTRIENDLSRIENDLAAERHREIETQTYAVTYPDEHRQPATFFITLSMERSIIPGSDNAGWTLTHVEGGVRPPGW
jgi:hypothetical protein